MDQYGFLRVAAAIPHVYVADCRRNAERHIALAQQAAQRGVEIVVFPELSLTGYTCGDLFLQPTLLDAAEALDISETVLAKVNEMYAAEKKTDDKSDKK